MILYHGTSEKALEFILKEGLKNPYLTDSLELAAYYAREQSEADQSAPLILLMDVEESYLRYDRLAMDEPVKVSESLRDRIWEQIAQEHPQWVKQGSVEVPETAWQYSLQAVHSVKYAGVINPVKISVIS